MRASVAARFWAKVRVYSSSPGGCWLWLAARDRDGYGRFTPSSEDGPQYAHRVAYALAFGPIPEGLTLDHLCRVRHCVNPAHLDAVPMTENLRRGNGPAAVNARKSHCLRGHPLDGENLYREPGTGRRHCRTCRREAFARWERAHREERNARQRAARRRAA